MVFKFLRRRPGGEIVIPDQDDGSAASTASGSNGLGGSDTSILNTLKQFEKLHHLDPNLPIEELNEIDSTLSSANAEKGIEIDAELEDNSPYPEVCHPERLLSFWFA
jgi:hypothetical protein